MIKLTDKDIQILVDDLKRQREKVLNELVEASRDTEIMVEGDSYIDFNLFILVDELKDKLDKIDRLITDWEGDLKCL